MVCLLTSLAASASAADIISQVRVLGAPSSIELESRAGEPLDSTKLDHDVKTLWRSGQVADVTVQTVADGEALQLLFRVRARRFFELRKVEIEPPTPGINPGIAPGGDIDSQEAQQAAARIRKQLDGSGFPNVTVTSRLVLIGAGKVDWKIHVDKGHAVDIGAVTFSGHPGVPASRLKHALGIKRRGYSPDAVVSGAANLRSFYFHHGYLAADVLPASLRIENGKAAIDYVIDSGPHSEFAAQAACREFAEERRDAERSGVLDFHARVEADGLKTSAKQGRAYRVHRIQFRGNHSFGDITLRRAFLLAEGDPLDETKLRKSLARLNRSGLFEPLTPSSVVLNTPPGTDVTDVTVWLKEKKLHNWLLSGPVGPMSLAGPLQFAIGTRLPTWGQGIFELSTYILSANLMLFAKPVSELIPFLPHKRFLPLLTLQRPLLSGQPVFSGITIAPQLGWRGMLGGYAASKVRNLTHEFSQTDRAFQSPLPVMIIAGSQEKGTMNCEVEKTKLDWTRQIAATAINLLLSFSPL
ncbi:MAG TPA: POTRA domain-containing protein [Bryobacteraceae bacterium]|nr:POTRA domain-containing protein [Bryobacteraceae bacterium]